MGIKLTREQVARLPAGVRQQIDGARRPSKYRARRVVVDGIGFHSEKEARRYRGLTQLMAMGLVKWFIRQPMFDTGGGTTYKADFLVVRLDGSVTVEDVKGYRTAAYKRAKKQVEALYGIEIVEV